MRVAKGLMVLGFGGHARSVADVAMSCGYDDFLFVDEQAREHETFLNFPVLAELPDTLAQGWAVFPSSGIGAVREQQFETATRRGWPLATIVSPTATVGVGAEMGAGTFVAHHAHVGPMARIGRCCILNTGSSVEHESTVGAFSHVSVNATVAGRSCIGERCLIGAGATVIDGLSVADQVIVGAGSVVISNLGSAGTVVGCPARYVSGI